MELVTEDFQWFWNGRVNIKDEYPLSFVFLGMTLEPFIEISTLITSQERTT